MAVLRCKMCGAQLNVNSNATSVECEYCGTVYALSQEKDQPATSVEMERLQSVYDAAEMTMNGSGTEAAYRMPQRCLSPSVALKMRRNWRKNVPD